MIAALLLLAAAEPPGLQAALKAVKQDGPVKLSAAAEQEIVALLPPARRGEECPEPAVMASQAEALKDRGDGAVLVVTVTTCKGARVFALSTGQPPRVARLLDYQQAQDVRAARALSLGGGTRERDLGLELVDTATISELRLFLRSDTGFSFSAAGVLKDFNALRECAQGSDDPSGWGSSLRSEKEKLAVLRVDSSCAGGSWQATCVLYRFDRGALEKAGVCTLPAKLDAKSLKVAGWK
ncbi:MAG TPA: hypothetical protein VLW85_01425 [Myxococcales bacterium]|nr:hypothetical protein [Myxococcales bacterium]